MQLKTPSYNFKSFIRRSNILFRVLLLGALVVIGAVFLFAAPADAAPVGKVVLPLVPCSGIDCTVCHLYEGVSRIINFLLFAMVLPLLVISLLAAGILYLISGFSEKYRTQAKEILWYAVVGTLIAFTAWVIVNTILDTLGFKIPVGGRKWSDTAICKDFDKLRQTPQAEIGRGGGKNGTKAIEDWEETQGDEGTALKANEGSASCATFTQAENDAINAAAKKYEKDGVTPERIKAIISRESGGDQNAQSRDNDGGSSYGLMQVRPETASDLDSGATTERLKDPLYNIDIGTEYYAGLLRDYGGNKDLASAAYNGGKRANKPSVNCPGLRRWQCEYDSNDRSVRNERPGHPGYGNTRRYVPAINELEQKFKSGECK